MTRIISIVIDSRCDSPMTDMPSFSRSVDHNTNVTIVCHQISVRHDYIHTKHPGKTAGLMRVYWSRDFYSKVRRAQEHVFAFEFLPIIKKPCQIFKSLWPKFVAHNVWSIKLLYLSFWSSPCLNAAAPTFFQKNLRIALIAHARCVNWHAK